MARRIGSVDPSKHPREIFDLYSIPAFDSGEPDRIEGASIGSTKQIVLPNDVLLSRIVPHIRRAWVVSGNAGPRQIASGEWIVFRSQTVHPPFLRHLLVWDGFHAQLMRTVSGVGGSLMRARPAHVANIEIPLPPLPEQRSIAAILDQAEALRAKRRQSLARLDALTQSIFIEMFGDPLTNERGWPMEAFATQFATVRYGTGSPPTYTDVGVPFIRATNIKNGSNQLAISNDAVFRLAT
jgi:type I restriction enzyme S subunit